MWPQIMSKTLLNDMRIVLSQLNGDEARETHDIRKGGLGTPLSSVLLCAEALGFVERTFEDDVSPVGDAAWSLSATGQRFLRFFHDSAVAAETSPSPIQVVITVPAQVRQEFELRNLSLVRTQECIAELLRSSSDELLIFSPYIDACFAHMSACISPGAAVRLVTTTASERFGTKPHPALARIVTAHPNFQMRYLFERNEFGGQQTQIHAKLIISDAKQAYVGSANLTETSLIHNLELGVLVQDTHVVKELRRIFHDVYEHFAKPFA